MSGAKTTLDAFVEFLDELPVRRSPVPRKFRTPWRPKDGEPRVIHLGRREYFYPDISRDTGLYRIVRIQGRTNDVTFTFQADGSFRVHFTGVETGRIYARSDADDEVRRLQALLMYHQFKEELCSLLLGK